VKVETTSGAAVPDGTIVVVVVVVVTVVGRAAVVVETADPDPVEPSEAHASTTRASAATTATARTLEGNESVTTTTVPCRARQRLARGARDGHAHAMAPMLSATCVWSLTDELLLALDDRFGEPVDAYVNGSQVWLRDDGPNGMTLEWRLHPVAGFRRPDGVDHYDLFTTVAGALASSQRAPVDPASLWDGLEAFPAHGDECEPAPLAAACEAALAIAPDHAGLVDHVSIGEEWERTDRGISIVARLIAQLSS